MSNPRPSILILGTRGIPAAHGGFETFAEHLALSSWSAAGMSPSIARMTSQR